jgi:hypothetical protein
MSNPPICNHKDCSGVPIGHEVPAHILDRDAPGMAQRRADGIHLIATIAIAKTMSRISQGLFQ